VRRREHGEQACSERYRMARSIAGFGVLGWVVLALVVSSLPALAQRAEPMPKALEGVGIEDRAGNQVPLELEFTDEDGHPVRLAQLVSGQRPALLTLVYYRCPMLCGVLLNGLLDGLRELSWTVGREFTIVTVSIDPLETPTLARFKKQNLLAEYARPGAGAGWRFLTGRQEAISRLAESVGFSYRFDEESKQFVHAAGIFVLTPDGRVSRTLYGVMFEPRTLRLALTEASAGRVGSAVDRIVLACFHYDANAGRYVVAAANVMRAGGVVTVVVVGAWLGVLWRRRARAAEKGTREERA
jgi:protein SCO1/2